MENKYRLPTGKRRTSSNLIQNGIIKFVAAEGVNEEGPIFNFVRGLVNGGIPTFP